MARAFLYWGGAGNTGGVADVGIGSIEPIIDGEQGIVNGQWVTDAGLAIFALMQDVWARRFSR